jgi:hypothetical protein
LCNDALGLRSIAVTGGKSPEYFIQGSGQIGTAVQQFIAMRARKPAQCIFASDRQPDTYLPAIAR